MKEEKERNALQHKFPLIHISKDKGKYLFPHVSETQLILAASITFSITLSVSREHDVGGITELALKGTVRLLKMTT